MNIGCDNRKSELKVEQNFRRKFAPKIKAQKEPKLRFIFQELKVTIRFWTFNTRKHFCAFEKYSFFIMFNLNTSIWVNLSKAGVQW